MSDASTRVRAYRVRLRPTPAQARTLSRLFGAKRFVWNWALTEQHAARAAGTKRPTWVDLSRRFTALRSAPDTAWLGELPREPFNQVLRDLDRAWSNAFASRARRPRRKKYGTVNALRFTLDQRREGLVTWCDDAGEILRTGSVALPQLGRIRMRVTEPMVGRLRSVTLSRDAGGRWHATFSADGVPAPVTAPAMRPALGIDMGLRETAVLSDGNRVAAARSLATAQARLRRYQRHYVRQRDAAARRQGLDPSKPFPKGTRIDVSNRMLRTRHQVGRLHARVADHRRDLLHRTSATAVRTANVIAIEDLAVKAMARAMNKRAFRRSVADAGLGELRRQLQYKAAWSNRVVVAVDRFYPSSKTCSACGEKHAALALRDRRWTCPACGADHDRDANAATNIEREGLRLLALNDTTPRSGGIHARGEDACATVRSPAAGQPTSTNRELTDRAARRSPRKARKDQARRGVG